MNKLNEKDIVQLFVSRLVRKSARRGASDDIAVIPVKTGQSCINLILKCDMLVENNLCSFFNETLANCKEECYCMC